MGLLGNLVNWLKDRLGIGGSGPAYTLPPRIECPPNGFALVLGDSANTTALSFAEEAQDIVYRHLPCYLRPPSRTVYLETPTSGEFAAIRQKRQMGEPCGWGCFAPYDGRNPSTLYLFRDKRGGDLRERAFRALHETGHIVWHYWLTDAEWSEWEIAWQRTDSRLSAREGFANTFADWCMGKRRGDSAGILFDTLLERIRKDGRQVYRG